MNTDKTQLDRSKEAVREVGTGDDEERFNEKLRRLAKQRGEQEGPMPTTTIEWVQLASATVFPLVILAVSINRLASGRGIGVRVVQFTAAAMVIPGVVILATGGYIGGETSAALIGAFIGYLFANIGNFDKPD